MVCVNDTEESDPHWSSLCSLGCSSAISVISEQLGTYQSPLNTHPNLMPVVVYAVCVCVFIPPTCCHCHCKATWSILVPWRQSTSSIDRRYSGDSKEDRWWCGSPWETERERATHLRKLDTKKVICSSPSPRCIPSKEDKVRRRVQR